MALTSVVSTASLFEEFLVGDLGDVSSEVTDVPPIAEVYTDEYCAHHGHPSTREWAVFILGYLEKISCGRTWYRYQKIIGARVIEAIILHETSTITALLSRQSGKSQILADLVPGLTIVLPLLAKMFPSDERFSQFVDGYKIGIFAPTMRSALLIYAKIKINVESDDFKGVLVEAGLALSLRGDGFNLTNESVCKAITASPDSKVEGETFHLIILEEAQLLTRWKIVKEIMPMAASTSGVVVAIGTSLKRCYFLDRILDNQRAFNRGEGKQNHFQCNYLEVVKHRREVYRKTKDRFHLNYENYVKGRMHEMGGEDSEEFRMNFLLLWSEDGLSAISSSALEEMRERMEEVFLPYNDFHCVAALDVAKGNYDASILTVKAVDYDNPQITETIDPVANEQIKLLHRYRKKVILLKELTGRFEGDEGQYNQVCEILNQIPSLKLFVVDSSGIGAAVAERFEVLLPHIKVEHFVFNLQSKSELYQVYLTSWRQKWESVVYGPIHRDQMEMKKFYTQHTNLEKNYKQGFLLCEAPEGEHDDYCLSPDTEILTDRGFVDMDGSKEDDIIANYVPDTGELFYAKSKRRIIKEYDGVMVHVQGTYVSQRVTLKHKMLYQRRLCSRAGEGKWGVVEAISDSLAGTRRADIRFIGTALQHTIDYDITDEEIKLAGWLIAEGRVSQSKAKGWNDHRYQLVRSTTKNAKHVQEIDFCVKKLKLDCNVYLQKDGLKFWRFRKVSKPFFDKLLSDGKQKIPIRWISKLSLRQSKLLLEALMNGGGCLSRNTYTSANLDLAKDVQELAFRCGVQAVIKLRKSDLAYNVYLHKQFKYGYPKAITHENYKGKVWCVTSDSGFIVIRHKGIITVTGNCDSSSLCTWGIDKLLYNLVEGINEVGTGVVHETSIEDMGQSADWQRAVDQRIFGAKQ